MISSFLKGFLGGIMEATPLVLIRKGRSRPSTVPSSSPKNFHRLPAGGERKSETEHLGVTTVSQLQGQNQD